MSKLGQDAYDDLVESATIEHRVVCKHYGKVPGHEEHAYIKVGLKLCVSYREKLNERYASTPEVPYRIEMRLISEWTEVPKRLVKEEEDDAEA